MQKKSLTKNEFRRIFEKMKGFTQDVEAIWFEGSGSGSSSVPRELPTPLLKEVDEQLKSHMQDYTSRGKSGSVA